MNFYISDGEYIRFEYEGKKIIVVFREDMGPISPREWEPLGQMVCWHRNYRLGDQHDYEDTQDFLREMTQRFVPWDRVVQEIQNGKTHLRVDLEENGVSLMYIYTNDWGSYEVCSAETADELFAVSNQSTILEELSASEMHNLLQASNKVVLMPLWLYDHSGISMSTSHTYPYNDRWDSGQVGWIYLSEERFLKETGYKEAQWPEKAREMLVGEVTTYDQYLRGEVFGFQVFILNEDTEEWEETDESCWGFYGDDLMGNGILDCIAGLADAVESGAYETGKAREVTVTTYEFD